MNIIKLVLSFLIVQGSDIVYNNLKTAFLNKIAKRDYCILSNESKYLFVIFNFHLRKNIINAKFKIKTFPWYQEEFECLNVDMENKSIETILNEFEEKLYIIYKNNAADSIILIYDQSCCRLKPIYKEIIKHMKINNDERKEMHIRHDIIYKYIIDSNALWYRMTKILEIDLRVSDGDLIEYKIPLMIEETLEGNYIVITIQLNNIYYCFEIDVKELDENEILLLIEFDFPHENERHKMISRLFCDLYAFVKTCDLGYFYQSGFSVCKPNEIKLSGNIIQIEIKCDKICFTINFCNFNYILKKNVDMCENEFNIYQKTYLEFQEVFRKIYAIEQIDEAKKIIELFFRLIRNKNQVIYLVNRILDKTGTALNIIFKHLIDCQDIFKKNELGFSILKEQINENERKLIIEVLQDIFGDYGSSSTYLIKICLFLEAEELLNKNEVGDAPIFGILKRITELVISQKNSTNITSSEENSDLCKAYQYLLKNCLADMETNKRNIWRIVYKFAALFTGLEKTKCKDDYYYYYYIVKSNEIAKLCLREKEVTKTYDLISKKILKKHSEDIKKENIKYLYRIKNIIESINKSKMSEEEIKIKRYEMTTLLNRINIKIYSSNLIPLKNEALNANIENLYDDKTRTKFENDLKERGREEIKNIIISDKETKDLIEIIKQYDKNILNEYNNTFLTNFFAELSVCIEKNVKKCSERDLPKVFVSFFKDYLNNDLNKQEACENILKKIINILSENGILKSLKQSEMTLHDDLVKSLEEKDLKEK
ncbi:uncharacterized protein VNE69_02230 [Vairimorpha necatrix]|uniref:Uncharacterized protein n=1 Tax=Vairimorpha necatrix TaxID=6039 RepID=A0AAX4J9Y4_9MICR